MKLSDFDFELPEELIALRPARPRSSSRLLVSQSGGIQDEQFANVSTFLRSGDRLVFNNTKVLPARLQGVRHRRSDQGETQAKISVTLMSVDAEGIWWGMARPAKRVNVGESIVFSDRLSAEVRSKDTTGLKLDFNVHGDDLDAALREVGHMPLPPYIASRRSEDSADDDDYQTIFGTQTGAVAAPTASLHFDQATLDKLASASVDHSWVTLHVGAGTFLPVKEDDISLHKMHSEWGYVGQDAAQEIAATQRAGGRIIPVGTTALRLVETAARGTGTIAPWTGDTDIFITPGFEFKVASGLITNFHLPKSTLMMLVSALVGQDHIKEIYRHAIENEYRFFSYGDASLLLP